ncbi:hypothetical protein [Ruegeria sp. HKCCD7255]|uniref:hypothetical protein n=1 Tax=Ruegeria sp. HKCCD7255 TaxID=2683004 RepID=UPI0014896089|nr:hypothetical protein [Ruegeria sp. HKCCD7255]
MKTFIEPRFTSEIFARRILDVPPDATIVDWAEKMVVAGFQSESLYVLLGELPPFNKPEIDDLLARVQVELNLPEIRSREQALEIVATAHARRLVQSEGESARTLRALSQLYADEGQAECLLQFYLLYYAKEDLGTEKQQHYWPSAHRGNINDVIHDYCQKWLAEHPFEEWREYEWSGSAEGLPR